jgi:hypothetical protein
MKRCGSPDEEFLHYTLWDVDPSLLADLLLDEVHGENRGKVLGSDRLPCARMEVRLEGCG